MATPVKDRMDMAHENAVIQEVTESDIESVNLSVISKERDEQARIELHL